MRTNVTFSLDTMADRDLLEWLNGLPRRERSAAIREALRAGKGKSRTEMAEVLAAIRGLESRLQRVAVAPAANATEEPPEAAAALDELGM